MGSEADRVITRIEKLIVERVSTYVGKTTVPDLMAIARRIASSSILGVFRDEEFDSITLGKMHEGEVFQVVQDPKDPSGIQVLLQEPLRRLSERGKVAPQEVVKSKQQDDDADPVATGPGA